MLIQKQSHQLIFILYKSMTIISIKEKDKVYCFFFFFESYLYLSAYYDGQHSIVYRCLLDGSNLEVFLHLSQPVLTMTIDYRHPRVYVVLADGLIESYAIDSSQPWKKAIYQLHSRKRILFSNEKNHFRLFFCVRNRFSTVCTWYSWWYINCHDL